MIPISTKNDLKRDPILKEIILHYHGNVNWIKIFVQVYHHNGSPLSLKSGCVIIKYSTPITTKLIEP